MEIVLSFFCVLVCLLRLLYIFLIIIFKEPGILEWHIVKQNRWVLLSI